jgi:hypothetical protein
VLYSKDKRTSQEHQDKERSAEKVQRVKNRRNLENKKKILEGRDFLHPSRRVLGPTQLPIQWVPRIFPGGKAAGSTLNYPPPSSAEVKERAELYLHSPSGSLESVLGQNLPSFFFTCFALYYTIVTDIKIDFHFVYRQGPSFDTSQCPVVWYKLICTVFVL